ncbi:MAG: RelA/SpoT family protein [Nanoarchaeota archaeon]
MKMAITFDELDSDFEVFLNKIAAETDFDINQIKKAYEFAKEHHGNQKRYSGDLYLTHPIEVSKIIYNFGLGTASIIAALLHDVVEDTNVKLEDIKKHFGDEIEILVDGLTKINTFTENREEKNIEALRKILIASTKDIRVLIIKLCDRLHNLRTLNELPEYKRERIARNTMLIYAPLAQKVGIYALKWELEDLSFKYRNPEMYQLIKNKIQLKREQREKIVQKAVDELKEELPKSNIKNIVVIGRPKSFYSVYKKIKDKAKSFEDIYDLYAIRVIVDSISDCYSILGFFHDKFQVFPNRLKDYIANPKTNGYQSLQTTIYSKRIRGPVEIQIRTQEMHKIAEYGIAAHWKYKNLSEDKKFEKKISWLREVLQWENENKDNIEFLNLLKYDFFQNEIFTFTPKNDVFFLPEGATVLDFAYALHTQIGDKAYKAKVNGEINNIDTKLKNGDIVEIITRNNVKPHEKWLKYVKTSKAKIKIRNNLNIKYKGNIKNNQENKIISFEQLKTKLTRINEFKKVRKAGCCKIKYGDQVVGVISKDNELVIHNAGCDNARYTMNKKIFLKWMEEKHSEIILNMILKDEIGIIVDILNIMSRFNLNISKLNTKMQKDGTVRLDLQLLDGPYMAKLTEELRKLDALQQIKTTKPGIFG